MPASPPCRRASPRARSPAGNRFDADKEGGARRRARNPRRGELSVAGSSRGHDSRWRVLAAPRCRRGLSEREEERGALADLTVGPDRAAVALDDPLDRGQTDAGALELARRVQALKGCEHLRGLRGVETRAVVADEVRPPPSL